MGRLIYMVQARDVKPALTDDEVLARVREYVEQSGKHEMPSQQELKNVRKDKQHPLRECACGLATLIFNSGAAIMTSYNQMHFSKPSC